jgi:hypothetical protein
MMNDDSTNLFLPALPKKQKTKCNLILFMIDLEIAQIDFQDNGIAGRTRGRKNKEESKGSNKRSNGVEKNKYEGINDNGDSQCTSVKENKKTISKKSKK